MSHWKAGFLKIAVLINFLTTTLSYSADLCDCGVVIGADYLYWSPCVSNMHFAAEGENPLSEEANHVKYHFIHNGWDSGYRVYLGKEDFFGCFDVLFSYTHFDAKKDRDAFVEEVGLLSLTWPTPFEVPYGKYATSDWKLDFDRYQLTAGYTIEFGKGCCLCLSPHAGVDYASICQDRTDTMNNDVPSGEGESLVTPTIVSTIDRSLDYNGIGPLVGMGYCFEFCEGLSTFGNASLSVLVGEVNIKDLQVFRDATDEDEVIITNSQKYHDNCVCLPGIHLQIGLSYEGCVCNLNILFRAGYEYIQWINAPSYILYNQEIPGTISGLNHNSITLEGFFGGLSVSF